MNERPILSIFINREWWETIISGEYQNRYEKMYSNR